jgi:hypothetical protein
VIRLIKPTTDTKLAKAASIHNSLTHIIIIKLHIEADTIEKVTSGTKINFKLLYKEL